MSTAEAEASASSAAILAAGPLLAPSTVQTPTSVGTWLTAMFCNPNVEPEPELASGAPGAGLTTTVMPSAIAVANGGTTRSLPSRVMPSLSRSSRTFAEFVLTDSACPPTTNVTCVREAMNHVAPTSVMLTANVVAWIARWIRNLRTRVGRTANLPPLVRGRLRGEATWPDRSHHVHGPRP